jgi:mannose-6-phosphate isomerase-like protein (cupin superfamily)
MSAADQHNRYPCEQVVPIEQEPRHHLVIDNEFVRAFAVEIAPHDRTLCHHHPHDYLVYVAGIADVVSARRNQEPKTILYKDGECELGEAGMVHVVENLKDVPFCNLAIELLPRLGELKRGPDPQRRLTPDQSVKVEATMSWIQDGLSRIRPHFESEKVKVFRVKVPATCEVEISGPAVIACPEGPVVSWIEPGKGPVIVNNFMELVWVPPHVAGLLRGPGAGVVVFQLGVIDGQSSSVRSQREPLKSLRAHADEPE